MVRMWFFTRVMFLEGLTAVIELLIKKIKSYGYIFASLMFITSFFSALCDFNFNFYVNKISLAIRCATVTALYDKLLQIPVCRLSKKFSSGQLINFMSTDVDRIVNFFNSFHALWSLIFKLGIALYLLYKEVGLAFLSGLGAALLMVPLNLWITFKIGNMSAKIMNYKDQRMRLITETMRAIRTVKLSNWEKYFEERIDKMRQKELKYLKGRKYLDAICRKYLDAICVYLWASAPVLITIAILSTYTLIMHEKLTAANVFTSLSLINILISPLNALPWVLLAIVEAYVSNKRIKQFFDLENIDLHSLYSLIQGEGKMLEIDNTTFTWNDGNHSVKDIQIVGKQGTIIGVIGPGTIIGVIGPVGSGKSTLLLGILGETELRTDPTRLFEHGAIKIPQRCITEGFAYVGHDCWLKRGSVKENILCGTEYQANRYNSVIRATALDHDIEKMPNKDEYIIGDEGTTLSGGQKARLALARALYQDEDIYLLDDPFASLDSKVSKYIWENCIEKLLKNRGKLVIIATHHTEYLTTADEIIMLNIEGKIIKNGKPEDVLTTDEMKYDVMINGQQTITISTNIQEDETLFDSPEPVIKSEEESRSGTVKIGVYKSYLKATGYILSILIGISIGMMQISKNLSDAWLSKWTVNGTMDGNLTVLPNDDMNEWYPLSERKENPIKDDEWDRTKYFLFIYIILVLINTILTLIRAFLFAYGGILSAKHLHKQLLSTVLKSKISWWDETPWGRVVNRLCSDVYTIDDSLPFQLNICLASLVNLIGALILTSFALPLLIPFIIGLFIVYYFIQRYYRFTTCEVKRLTSISLSPLYSHITDTVTGLITIRAHRFVERFTELLRSKLENNLIAQYSNLAASQWLSVRLQLLGTFMVSAVSFMAVLEIRLHYVESGLVGLAIAYALSMNNLLNSLLCSFIETEKELVAVERVVDYIEDIPKEETNHEKEQVDKLLVAIIGRTGSGKSSIFQALTRAHLIETGKIYIDQTIDILSLDLKAVRSIFGYVTQSPFIFSGTIRENFCVNSNVTDDLIIEIINKAGLTEWLQRVGGLNAEVVEGGNDLIIEIINKAGLTEWLQRVGGLNAEVVEGGSNFSFGEKQIICFCRLILSKPKIILIDEATAHLDDQTHQVLNKLLREILPTTTVISIMHRLSDLSEFDFVIEMSNGFIHRIGTPNLFQKFDTRPSSSSDS
uniref:Uncharacterized protein n=1 Tax=Panagrolaimus sp. JU765 TaxID=591449 RepID=A0AC34QIF0_9BILA